MKDYQSELSEVYKELEDGDLSVEEAMQRSNAITAEMATERGAQQATQAFETTLQERDAQAIEKQWLKDHPDFTELRDGGKLEPIKKELGGMHDDFSAYFAYKAGQAGEEKPSVEEEQINKPQTPLSEAETEASMLKAMGEG